MKKIYGPTRVLSACLSLALCLSACSQSKDTAQTNTNSNTIETAAIENGVALTLAQSRAANISNIIYDLEFTIPAERTQAVIAKERVNFALVKPDGNLLLDFRESSDRIKTVTVNGENTPPLHKNEHLIIPASLLQSGDNIIDIEFIAGDTSLNRNPDFLYTLFVPDRARTAFPVFDQPNLKARYNLTLNVPETWQALSNAPLKEWAQTWGQSTYTFETSDLMSSYLFSFVAGEFETITRTLNGREMTMLHRETNPEKIDRNVDAIFQAHADALSWLEDYTGIPYPFKKFDFAAIPGFQYGGMEHVGAIQYRASTLFLDADPSDPQRLNRANLIAHETAHMWFGDLVTMDWFNDVWTKEVFANFMAAKIVNPSFPNIDHDLNFLLRSYPAAYSVDRTQGANPIRQNLPNLNEAGTLYGAIIYNKAPIMMQQLELLLGEALFRDGMREYLSTHANKNATWPDLIKVFDKRSDQDLKAWSEVWVNTAGRPHFTLDDDFNLTQLDPSGAGRIWPQQISYYQYDNSNDGRLEFNQTNTTNQLPRDGKVLFNANGEGYGLFPVDLELIKQHWTEMSDLRQGAQLINLFEQMLEGSNQVSPDIMFDFLAQRLTEPNQLLLDTMLRQMRQIYWSYMPEHIRTSKTADLERTLWKFIDDEALPASTRKIYLRSLQSIAQTPETLNRFKSIWSGTQTLKALRFSPREKSNMAAILAIKLPQQSDAIITKHINTLKNPDERRRFEFIAPTLSPDVSVRDSFFTSLKQVENRANENWTLVALGYLHHPSRTDHSQTYLTTSLELLEEIQQTGDIFFPARWTAQSLSNHTSAKAAQDVRDFLAARPNYNAQLKLKVLQAADPLFRARNLNP